MRKVSVIALVIVLGAVLAFYGCSACGNKGGNAGSGGGIMQAGNLMEKYEKLGQEWDAWEEAHEEEKRALSETDADNFVAAVIGMMKYTEKAEKEIENLANTDDEDANITEAFGTFSQTMLAGMEIVIEYDRIAHNNGMEGGLREYVTIQQNLYKPQNEQILQYVVTQLKAKGHDTGKALEFNPAAAMNNNM